MKKLIITVIAIMAITALNLNILRATTDDNNQGLEPYNDWKRTFHPCPEDSPWKTTHHCIKYTSGECTVKLCI